MEIASSASTLKRYVRYEPTGELVLTERTLDILCDLHDRGFMNTRQFQKLYGANVDELLKRLFRHGYIDRPKAGRHWRIREGGGSYSLIYALANRDARALVVHGRRPDATRRDWTERNRELSALSSLIPHELGVADVYVSFGCSCAARTELALVQGCELAAGRDGRALVVPGEARLLEPDWIFALVARDLSREPCLFFVERHTGTEPNTRHGSPHLEHLTGKYQGYLAYARARRSAEQFGIGNFRVLTVTSGGEINVGNIARAAYDVCEGVGVGRFLVTSMAALEANDPLAIPWLDAAGNAVRLIA